MKSAIELSQAARGSVEPNPMVGCLLVKNDVEIGRGFHEAYGGPHAEIQALSACTQSPAGATAYVSLEPCAHHGKTPPCAEALIQAGVSRVVVACEDPFDQVRGRGIEALRAAGIEVTVGVGESLARSVHQPFFKLCKTGRPWVIAKWAMSIDGKIATRTGDSQWISCEASRELVHSWRGQLDAIIVGRQTVEADNPMLTPRPRGPRLPLRIVIDSLASLPNEAALVQTVDEAPVMVCCGPDVTATNLSRLKSAGVEVLRLVEPDANRRLELLLDELGRRRMTNVMVEGGGRLLGGFFETDLIDEVRAFIAPRIIGGAAAPSPVGGSGFERLLDSVRFNHVETTTSGIDTLVIARREQY
jgi:diaminohydroxyphosphoribosylaminopyrimidine deaminase/5-amino-6-(5-phosphoribosylamino)uracil reductase